MNNNEVRIKPLLRYEVVLTDGKNLVFTADGHDFDNDSYMYRFRRTGNLIREISRYNVDQIIATPDA